MGHIKIFASELNKGIRPEYNTGDTLIVAGDQQLNKTGWFTLAKGNKTLHSPFHLILGNGQRDFCGLKFGDPRHELRALSIEAPDIEIVPDYTFWHCRYLEKIRLRSARMIQPYAFEECLQLRKVSFPSVEKVHFSAFGLCHELIHVHLPQAISIGKNAFSHCHRLILLNLPMAVSIDDSAFSNCSQLVSVRLPSCRVLGKGAFSECDRLRRLKMPEAAKIGPQAFRQCFMLKHVRFPSAQVISDGAFAYSGIETAFLPSACEIGELAFHECKRLTRIDFPEAAVVHESAFQGCFSYLRRAKSPLKKQVPYKEQWRQFFAKQGWDIDVDAFCNRRITMYELNEKEFENYDMKELASAVKNGLDVYHKMENIGDWHQATFYEAAIRFGTPELVKACIEMGANPNCADIEEAMQYGSPLSTFTLGIALNALNLGTFRVLLESGANPRYLYVGRQGWHLRKNIIPEIHHPDTLPLAEQKRLVTLKENIDKGTEIVRILRSAGIHIPGTKPGDDTISLFEFWRNDRGWSSWKDEGKTRWYDLKPEDLDDFNDKAEYYSEDYGTDGWGCDLPAPGSRPDALWHAASPEALKRMLDAGSDVNMRDGNGYTALHHLAFYGGKDYYFMPEVMMQMLIDAGADVNERNDYGACPLLLAAEEIRPHPRSIELVKVLLRNGADIHAQTRGDKGIVYWSSKYWYTIGGFENSMLREGALELVQSVAKDSETIEELGTTNLSNTDIDLMTAAFWGTADDLKPILERGANINARTKRGYTPLMFSSVYNHEEAVQFLSEQGADVNAQNERCETPLSLACMTNDYSVIYALIHAGVNPQIAGRPFNQLFGPLSYLGGIIGQLIKHGANPNARDSEGNTLFMASMGHCEPADVRAIILFGADVTLRDREGCTVLMREMERFYPFREGTASEMVDVLVKSGVDVNAKDDKGWTALFYAVKNAGDAVFPLALLDNGADVNIRDNAGDTALNILLRRKSYDTKAVSMILPVLLRAGAVLGEDLPEKSPLDEIENEEDAQLASMLKSCELIPCNTFKEAFAKNGDTAMASLVAEGFPFDLNDEEHINVFDAALRNGMTETILACLGRGKNIDENWSDGQWINFKSFPGSYPIFQAIDGYSVPAVKLLLELGASIFNVRNIKWRLRLNRFPEADGTEDKELLAVQKKNDAGAEILRLLHEKDPVIPCEWEGRELTYIYAGNQSEKADSVLFGDDLNKTENQLDEPKDLTALRLAMSPEAIKEMLNTGVNVNAKDALGKNILHYLVQRARYNIKGSLLHIRECIKAGADVSLKDNEGHTPLALALEMVRDDIHMLELVMLLLQFGADAEEIIINKDDADLTIEILDTLKRAYLPEPTMNVKDAALITSIACSLGTKRYGELLECGADINVKSRKGYTLPMFAVGDEVYDNGYTEDILFLAANGADLNAKNEGGECALTLAMKHGRFAALAALISAGADTSPLLEQKDIHE